MNRLQGLKRQDVAFYNIDGIEVVSWTRKAAFTPKDISIKFKHLKIWSKDIVATDSLLGLPNFRVIQTDEKVEGLTNYNTYYFVADKNEGVLGVAFGSVNKTDPSLERALVRLIYNNAIPETVFARPTTDTIRFVGRDIPIGASCQWMGVNNLQCPHFGQMNWSSHQTLPDAEATVANDFRRLQSGTKGKIVADTVVPVTFEGTKTTARRVVYDFTGVTSFLVGMSGGKTLTIYLVAAPVRGQFISCMMSFWNNDAISKTGLVPLLDQVLQLQ